MKRFIIAVLGFIGFVAPPTVWADGPTLVQGSISANTTWSPRHNPYIVIGDVTVEKGAVLTLKPGTQVYFAPANPGAKLSMVSASAGEHDGLSLIIEGGLLAVGSEKKAVYFIAGDSLTRPSLIFRRSDPLHSILENCVINGEQVVCVGSSPLIQQCVITGSTVGVEVDVDSKPLILSNRITGNAIGLSLNGGTASPTVTGNLITDNANGIYFAQFGAPQISGNRVEANKNYNLVNASGQSLAGAWNDLRLADAHNAGGDEEAPEPKTVQAGSNVYAFSSK